MRIKKPIPDRLLFFEVNISNISRRSYVKAEYFLGLAI